MQLDIQQTQVLFQQDITNVEAKAVQIIQWAYPMEKPCRIERTVGMTCVRVGTLPLDAPSVSVITWHDVPYEILA